VARAVQSAVQQTADEVVRSVAETDWKSEISAFTHEVEAEAQRAVEVVQHLPDKLHVAEQVCARCGLGEDLLAGDGGVA
jgi:hypothetical protein